MKNIIRIIALTALFLFIQSALFAQPLPYDTGIGGGEGTNPVGGGAPIGGGLITFFLLAAGYAISKNLKRKKAV